MTFKKFEYDDAFDFFDKTNFFCLKTSVFVEEAVKIFDVGGMHFPIPPHPFFNKDLYSFTKREDPGSEFIGWASPLLDVEYYGQQYGVPVEQVLTHVSNAVIRDEFVEFCPLLTRSDFKASKFSSLSDWIELLNNPNVSLVGQKFVKFMPEFYRSTAKNMYFENELLDYLFNKELSAGQPHVLFDNWYYAQKHPSFLQERSGHKPWYYVNSTKNGFGENFSPFYDPMKSNHDIVTARGKDDAVNILHRIQSEFPAFLPHREVLPSALLYAFLDKPITECYNNLIDFDDVLEALAVARTHKPVVSRDKIKLSVCILNYGKPTFSILSALAAARNSPPDTEVLVLENGSDPKDFEMISKLTSHSEKIRVIRSPKNLYFGEGNNVLLDMTQGDNILFLNNDAFVGPNTIARMLTHLGRNRKVSAAGVTFLFPDLKVQESGGIVSDCGQQIQLRKGSDLKDHMAAVLGTSPIDTQYISSACFCVRKEVLQDIGGYDLLYEPLYFEDTDLCKRITSLGKRIELIPDEYVIHFENASTKEFLGDGFMAQIAGNRQKFRQRWMYAKAKFKPREMLPALQTAFDKKLPTALVYTPFNMQLGGGERYILSVVAALSKTYNVILATNLPCSKTRVSFVAQSMDVIFPKKGRVDIKMFDEALQFGPFDLMVVMGNQIIPPVPLLAKKNVYHCQFPFPGHHVDAWQSHRLENVDEFWVNSKYTQHFVRRGLEDLGYEKPVNITYAPVSGFTGKGKKKPTKKSFKVVNIGRFDPAGHGKQQDTAIEIFRAFSEKHPDATLDLVGGLTNDPEKNKYFDGLKKAAEGLNVNFHPNASRAAVEKILMDGDIYLHCCGFGRDIAAGPEYQEHFGIAVVEGMMAGLIPVVYDGGGPKEIVEPSGEGGIYSSKEGAVEILEKLYESSQDELIVASKKVAQYATRFSDKVFVSKIEELT